MSLICRVSRAYLGLKFDARLLESDAYHEGGMTQLNDKEPGSVFTGK